MGYNPSTMKGRVSIAIILFSLLNAGCQFHLHYHQAPADAGSAESRIQAAFGQEKTDDSETKEE